LSAILWESSLIPSFQLKLISLKDSRQFLNEAFPIFNLEVSMIDALPVLSLKYRFSLNALDMGGGGHFVQEVAV